MSNITIYPNVWGTDNGIITDSAQIIKHIRDGRWQKEIAELNTLEPDSPAQKEAKKNLPAIVWQGSFSNRNAAGITQHSGLVACDFDHIPDDQWDGYWTILSELEYTYALFRSPRRDGMKCIIRMEPNIQDHKLLLNGLRDLFRDAKYYDHYDDICRYCFVSYDPDLYFNPDATVYSHKIQDNQPAYHPAGEVLSDYSFVFNGLIKWVNNRKGLYYSDGSKHNFLFALISACNRAGIPKEETLRMCWETYSKYQNVQQVPFKDFESRVNYLYKHYSASFSKAPFKLNVPSAPEQSDIEPEMPKIGFPVDVLPVDIVRYIGELNSALNYSRDYLSIAAMWSMATINGNRYKLRVKNGWIAPTIFWFAAVGEPGTMKSHPIETIIRPIKAIDRQSKLIYDGLYAEFEAGGMKGKCPHYKQILVSDSTLEALHLIHSINARGIGLFKDELVGFLNDMNRYRKGSDEQFWLESFNNNSYPINRVTRQPLLINDTMINILGTIQPAVLTKITREMSGNGMIDRFLFTTNETGIYPMNRNDISKDWLTWWDDAIKTINSDLIYTDREDTEIIDMDDEAMTVFIDTDVEFCALQRSDNETASLKNYISKMKTYLPRFALLMWLFDRYFGESGLKVTADHMTRAKRICDYFITAARNVFAESEQRQEIESVVRVMNGKTKIQKIIDLHRLGFKQVAISKELRTPKSYVSKVLKESGEGGKKL